MEYEQTFLEECKNCSYRLSKLQEEETEQIFNRRIAIAIPISLERMCKNDFCLLEGRRRNSSSQIFINRFKLNNMKIKKRDIK